MESLKKSERQIIKGYVYLTLLMVYIIPTGLLFGSFSSIHNHIFAIIAIALYLLSKIRIKLNPKIVFFWTAVVIIAFITGKYGFMDMIIIPIIGDLIKYKQYVKQVIQDTKIIYICAILTVFYSLVYSQLGIGGRGEGLLGSGIVFTAIGEVNLSGLSCFCLALLALKKNRKLGWFLFLFGALTLSRSYLLAIACVFIFKIGAIKRFVNKHLRLFTYFKLTIFSVVILYLLGLGSIVLYQNGGIVEHSTNAGFSRLFTFNDYSNYFRFLANYLVAAIMCNSPAFLFTGMTDAEFLASGLSLCSSYNVPFLGIAPHNIFFSHLKIYGIWVFLEIAVISIYLKRIVNSNNFGIYIAIFLYGVILGTGFYNYWLFLSVIALIMYESNSIEHKQNSNFYCEEL